MNQQNAQMYKRELLGLLAFEVVQQYGQGMGVFAKIGDDSNRSADDFTGFAFSVDFTQSTPFTQLFTGWDKNEVDAMFFAQGTDQFGVRRFITILSQTAQTSTTAIQRLGTSTIVYNLLTNEDREGISTYSCNPRRKPS